MKRRMKHLRRRTLSGLVFTILFVHFTGGCDTLNSDLAGLGDAFSPPTPGEAARWMIDPTNAENRRRGTVIIANSSVGAVPVNVAWYRDRAANERDALVLAVSLSALARYGTPDDASLLTPHLEHPDVQVRWAAARGLQRLHNPEAIGSLLSRLRDDGETTDVRVAVARALGQYPGDRAFQGLLAALNKRELALNRAALTSLTTMTGEDFGLDSNAWRAWYRRPDVGADRAFAKGTEYLYPVYDRDVSWLERMAFWSTPRFESPAQPAGLRPENERRTYDEADTGEES